MSKVGRREKMSPQDRMTVEEMSELIGVCPNTIQRRSWRRKNNFPADRIGNHIVGLRQSIEKWIIDKTNGRN